MRATPSTWTETTGTTGAAAVLPCSCGPTQQTLIDPPCAAQCRTIDGFFRVHFARRRDRGFGCRIFAAAVPAVAVRSLCTNTVCSPGCQCQRPLEVGSAWPRCGGLCRCIYQDLCESAAAGPVAARPLKAPRSRAQWQAALAAQAPAAAAAIRRPPRDSGIRC